MYCQKIQEYKEKGRTLVYVDESGFAHDMPRTHGYAKRGKRCIGMHDWGAKGRTNVIGAMVGKELLTVSLFDSTIDTAIFDVWVKEELVPMLSPKSIVVLDNATFHKGRVMKKAIEDGGHTLLYLPPYSPDLNLIEQKWSQAKSLRRKKDCSVYELFQHVKI